MNTFLELQAALTTALARIDAMEAMLEPQTCNLSIHGNATLRDEGREPSNPVKLFMGKLAEATGLYFFWQKRFPGQSEGTHWAGMETSQQPPDGRPVAEGYGALPMRLWGQNVLLEANGSLVVRTVVAEKVYMAMPVYRHRWTGAFVAASRWSDAGEPLDEQGRVMGGIYYPADLGVYLAAVNGEAWVFTPAHPDGVRLA